jgi:hypothetical protein
MEPKKIILIFLIIILFLLLIHYIMKDSNKLSDLTSAETSQTISPSDLPDSETSSNFTYSIWFYIDDWNYRYGDRKVLFERVGNDVLCPRVFFTPSVNNLSVNLTIYPTDTNTIAGDSISTVFTCGIPNVPLQKWCNFLMTSYGRTIDLYLDGKLVKTCVLPGVAKIEPSASVYITPNGGFSGWTSTFKYWGESTNPQKAWDIYKEGYGGNWLGNLFGQYSLKISIVEGDTEETTITL